MSKGVPKGPKPVEYKGHNDRIWSICVGGEAEAAVLYTGSEDGTVRSWNIETCEQIRLYAAHKAAVTSICVADENLFTASSDKSVIHWTTAGEKVKVYDTFVDSVRCVAASGETLAAGGVDGVVKFFQVGSEDATSRDINAHRDVVSCAAFNASDDAGTLLFTGSYDKTIKAWDPAAGTLAKTFAGHDNHVKSIAFGGGGATMYSGSRDETVRIWNTADGRCVAVLTMPSLVNCLAVQGNAIFCGFSDGRIRVLLNKEIQSTLSSFKDETSKKFEEKKKALELQTEKQIKKLGKAMQKKIAAMAPKESAPAEGGEGEEGEDAAAPEEGGDGEAINDAKIQEMQDRLQADLEAQSNQLRKALEAKVEELGKVRDRSLVINKNHLEDFQSKMVHTMPQGFSSVLTLCVNGKDLFVGDDNEVLKVTSQVSVVKL